MKLPTIILATVFALSSRFANKTELHVDSFGKQAAAFLRNSRIASLGMALQREAQRFGPALKVGEDALRYCCSYWSAPGPCNCGRSPSPPSCPHVNDSRR